jgi:hypothetical protein
MVGYMPRLEIHLPEMTMEELRKLAEEEYRDPRAQAAVIIIRALEHQAAHENHINLPKATIKNGQSSEPAKGNH